MSSSSSKYPPLSSSTSSSSSLLRYRSGSVERSRVNTSTSSTSASSRDPAPYKTSYGAERGRSRDVSTSRMSRATSYDPFATSSSKTTRASSVIRTSGLSNSDYSSPRSALSSASRYGSTEQLNSSSYRSSYRFGSNSNSGATPSSSTYTPRNVRAGSVSIGAYDPPSSSLSRYRPTADTSSSSTYTPTISRYRSTDLSNTSDYSSKYRSPDNSTRCSSITSSRYSKPSPYSSRTSTSSSYRSDRDYRSMSRTDNEEEGDEVETTFRKLYRKYVTDSEPDLSRNVTSLADEVTRRFASKTPKKSKSDDDENSDLSISEGDEEDAEEGVLEKFREKGRLRRASSAGSITPRASVCNSPSKDVTPKCSPLPARKEIVAKSLSRSVSPVEDKNEEGKKKEEKPLTRSFQMEATFGALTEKKVEAKKMEETVVIDPPKIFESVADLPIKKVVAASIKINGLPVKMVEKPSEENQPEKEAVPAVRIRIRSGKSPTRTPEPPETPPISTAANVVDESPREKSSESDTSSSRASSLRKRRDPNRTLENLQSILKAEKMEGCNEEKKEEAEPPKPRKIPIPLVLITEPSNPSTPLATTPVTTAASICLWNKSSTSSDGEEEDEDEEYEDEDEYSSGDWTEGEDDEEYLSDEEEDEFSVSQTFSLKDHINLYPLATSSSNTSALVSEFSPDGDDDTFLTDARKEESRGRVDSLFAVPAPTFTCSVTYDGMLPGDEEEEEEWSDEVHSCEEGDDEDFRVLPIGRPGSSSLGAYMSTENITSEEEDYDGRTVGCTLKLVDKAARKDSEDDSDDSEYYDDEEEEEEYSDEEYWDEEIEYEDEEEYEYEDEEEEEEVLEEFVDDDDVSMRSVESSECEESVEEEVQELFVTPMKLMTESLVEEMIEEACIGELPEETLFALDGVEVEDYTGTKDIQMIPTFVRPLSEDVHEESASRFAADRKPATDFARKAVIQPTKLEKVQVGTKIDTKLAPSEEEKRKMREAEEEEKRRKEALERKRKEAESVKEDKSSVRKSALNMKDEDAKKKVATEEKVAAQKARRFGTVSAMAGKFDDVAEEPEKSVLYKKSLRLEPTEKPKRTYEVIKPVINDDFDKQMEEIRKQMKTGSNELQSKMKMLSKGILTTQEEAKLKEIEEKRRVTTEKATGAFGKAEEEKARWKANRDAEAALEYAKIEAEKHLKKKRILIDKPSGETVLNQEKAAEPKRTVRRWKPPPPDPNAVIPSFSCGPKEAAKPKVAAAAAPQNASESASSKPSTPTSRRKVTSSPTVTRKMMAASPTTVPGAAVLPKSDGAAATRIRNNAATATVPDATPTAEKTPSKRYSSRRKTQEIVNESAVKPKTKRRKLKPRKRRFIREDHDADSLLGFQKNATFEQLERFFEQSARQLRTLQTCAKVKRMAPSKVFISDLTDIDKIYKSSEIRDIIASVNLVY